MKPTTTTTATDALTENNIECLRDGSLRASELASLFSMKTTATKTPSRGQAIIAQLHAHLMGDGCYNDSDTEGFYREYFNIPDDEATDSDDVDKWAVETAQAYARQMRADQI